MTAKSAGKATAIAQWSKLRSRRRLPDDLTPAELIAACRMALKTIRELRAQKKAARKG